MFNKQEIKAIVSGIKTQHRIPVTEVLTLNKNDLYKINNQVTIRILNISLQHIQAITEEEALASGLEIQKCEQGSEWFLNPMSNMISNVFHRDEWKGGFESYWDSLHGKLSFNNNPQVWVVHFEQFIE